MKVTQLKCNLDTFIEGETIDLCAPSEDELILEQWFRWFNKSEITKYLNQGLYPNTLELQKSFFKSTKQDQSRFTVLIRPKHKDQIIGVASLSFIDHIQRQCDFSMVIGERTSGGNSLFHGLETKARLTQHAFDILGMERVNTNQAKELARWQRWQILFGYQIEGILRNKFRKGNTVHDTYLSSCILQDYNKLLKIRGGRYWPGKSEMFELIKKLPKNTLIDELDQWLPEKQENYWNNVFLKLK
jgi:[ribosomal protein S5]-alanine N-acetyltransferase